MNNISDFEKRISYSMDRVLKVLEKSENKNAHVYGHSDEVSHLEKMISKLERDKETILADLQSALDEVSNLNERIETLMSSMENERIEYKKQQDDLALENSKIRSQINFLQVSRKDQVDEINSILADLEPMLENTGEMNA